jgi:hypothetical protein
MDRVAQLNQRDEFALIGMTERPFVDIRLYALMQATRR